MADESIQVGVGRGELVPVAGIDGLLAKVRPEWQARDLIGRVRALLPVDPSSACQRLLNAAIHDLRQKILIAGLDIATEAAAANQLPPVSRNEDILESYSPFHTLELAYRMGLLDRPDWKRLRRAYEIRRDLEHEDNEYVAELEDVVYIFRSAIEIVLSRDPMQLPRVADVKELVEAPTHVVPSPDFVADYAKAPALRQVEIARFLARVSLDSKAADITRQNSVEALRCFAPVTQNTVKIDLAKDIEERGKRRSISLVEAKVAAAGGFLPYLKQRLLDAFLQELHGKLELVGYHWTKNTEHRPILDDLEDVGGLVACPEGVRGRIVLWMVLCYIGEPGGYGFYGRYRKVFYSNSGSHRIERLIEAAKAVVRADLENSANDSRVKSALLNPDVKERYDSLLALVPK
jgi:hypothetical protein